MISSLFSSRKLNRPGIKKSEYITEAFNTLLTGLTGVCPVNREFLIAVKKLEEACFFARKAMTLDPSNQE